MISFKVTKDSKNNLLRVDVEVPKNKSNRWWVCGTKQVLKYLKENNIKHGKCLNPREFACNEYPKLEAQFLFELKKEKKLDKPSTPVVKLDNEDVVPKTHVKPTRRRRKATSKKEG